MKKVIPWLLVVLLVRTPTTVNGQVVVTTSLLESVVKELAGHQLSVNVLVTSNLCPGHADVGVEKMAFLERCQLFLAHGFEPYLPRLEKSIFSLREKKGLISLPGNWQIPAVHLQAAILVNDTLCSFFPDKATFFRNRLNHLSESLKKLDRDIQRQVSSSGWLALPVICNSHLADLCAYLGLKVVATYGSKEDFSPELLASLLKEGKTAGVKLIIDNLQAGRDTGKSLANDLEAKHIVFSNFPGEESLPGLLKNNLEKIFHVWRSFGFP
ncbi:MAG: zinc ABC transporter substrate-binding protein [Candidatus Omnitrophica bacterium]|nr:zinc ABC transporter substrate-binding protein [Candidatus Omnitrophota bacterium]